MLALHRDGARLRLKFNTNGSVCRIHNSTNVSFVNTRANLLRLANQAIVATSATRTTKRPALRRRSHLLVTRRHQLGTDTSCERALKKSVTGRLGGQPGARHHLCSETTTSRALTTMHRAITRANAHNTSVFLDVSRANPKRSLVNVLNSSRDVFVHAIYDANHRTGINSIHVYVLSGDVTAEHLLLQILELQRSHFGTFRRTRVGHHECDILLDANDATNFGTIEHG